MPSPETEDTRAFRTHASYLRAFRELALGDGMKPLATKIEQLHSTASEKLLTGRPADKRVNSGEAIECLHRAWGTELILGATHTLAEDSEIVRLANSWAAVQAYYALYGAAQAVLVVDGKSRPTSHEPTLRQIVDLWVGRSFDLPPWSFASCHPARRHASGDGYLGGPGRPLNTRIHPWSAWSKEEAWDIAGLALRTTRQVKTEGALAKARDRKTAERKRNWAEEEKRRLASGVRARREPTFGRAILDRTEKAVVETQMRPCTFADYLYRLRIKANYEDVNMFAQGPESDSDAEAVGLTFVALTSANLLVHELRVIDRLGKTEVLRQMDAWLDRHQSKLCPNGLLLRRDLHASL